jgi:MFS family permease
MSETTVPRSEPPISPATTTNDENAGRLDGASTGRLLAILIALILFSEIVPFQYTMTGVLIPKIGAAFPAAGNSTSWAITILGVVGAATMALAGKASDLWGKKRILLFVGIFFLVGTFICAVTSNWALFLVGRGLEALCLGIPAISYGIVRDLIPRRWIPIAVGLVATGLGVSSVAAPIIGGLLTDHYSWRSVFWFLIAYAVVAALGLALVVPESPYRVRQRFDWVGSLLIGAGVAGVLIYLSEGTSWGWGSSANLVYLIGGLVLLVLFVLWESRISYPMMELSMLRAPQVSIVMAIAVFVTMVLTLPSFLIPYMMETPTPGSLRNQILTQAAAKQHVSVALVKPFLKFQGDINYAAGLSVFQLAWHVLIFISISSMIFGPIGGLIARRYGARLPMLLGTLALVVSFELWSRFHGSWVDLATIGVLEGVGFGFYYAAGPNLLIDVIPAARQGISAGMLGVFGAIGAALGTALVTPILAAHPYYLVATPPGGKPQYTAIPQVYTNVGYSWGFLLIGALGSVIALILAYSLRSGRTPARGGAPEGISVLESALQEAAAAQPTTAPTTQAPAQEAVLADAWPLEAQSAETLPDSRRPPSAESERLPWREGAAAIAGGPFANR